MRKTIFFLVAIILLVGCTVPDSKTSESDQALDESLTAMTKELKELEQARDEANKKAQDLEKELSDLKKEYSDYQEQMKPYEELNEAEITARLAEAELAKIEAEAEKAEKEAADKAAKDAAEAERAAKEAEEQAAIEAEEKLGYDTGISYDQLARTPKDHVGKKVKFTGTVVQLMEGDTFNQLRFAVSDDYNQMLYLEYDPSELAERVLEDDTITIYGIAYDTITYESTMSGNITIPAVIVDKLEIHK